MGEGWEAVQKSSRLPANLTNVCCRDIYKNTQEQTEFSATQVTYNSLSRKIMYDELERMGEEAAHAYSRHS
jgi:hypothetical protein